MALSAVGALMREEMRRYNWVQLDVAAILGCAPSAVSGWMTGRRRLTAQNARDLQDVFQIPAVRFLEIQGAERLAELDADPVFATKLEGIRERAAYLEAHGHTPKWAKCSHCGHRITTARAARLAAGYTAGGHQEEET